MPDTAEFRKLAVLNSCKERYETVLAGYNEPGNFLTRYRHWKKLNSNTVVKCRSTTTGQAWAAKIIPVKSVLHLTSVLKEVEILKLLHHKNLIEVHESHYCPKREVLVMELIDGYSLQKCLKALGRLSEPWIGAIARQVLSGLAHLHGLGVIHRDIMPSNIMITKQGVVKIVGFGLALRTSKPADFQNCQETVGYMSPEAARYKKHAISNDIWAFGVTTTELIGCRKSEVVKAVIRGDPILKSRDVGKGLTEVIDGAMVYDAGLRSTAAELLELDFVKNAGGECVLVEMVETL